MRKNLYDSDKLIIIIHEEQHKYQAKGPVTMSVNIKDCKLGMFAYSVTGTKYKGKIG